MDKNTNYLNIDVVQAYPAIETGFNILKLNHLKALPLLFSAAAGSAYGTCCENPLTATAADLTYKPLKSAGVLIQGYDESILPDGSTQFYVDSRKINGFAYFFAQTIGFYKGPNIDKNQPCPQVNLSKDYFKKEKIDDHTYRITIQVSPEIIKTVKAHNCVLTLKP